MPSQHATKAELVERVRALAPNFAARADTAEKARRMPIESVREMLDAGIARILMPKRFGGYDLDFETWHDVVLEISRADCSHGWCASLLIHHPHLIAQYPEECQQAIWKDGPDVPIAASFAPRTKAVRVAGGYRLTGNQASFSSGVDHCTWVMVGAMYVPSVLANHHALAPTFAAARSADARGRRDRDDRRNRRRRLQAQPSEPDADHVARVCALRVPPGRAGRLIAVTEVALRPHLSYE